MTKDEEALETARAKVHGKNPTQADRRRFKELQGKVHEARRAEREAEGRVGVSVVATNGEVT